MDSGVQLFEVAKDPNQPDIDMGSIPPSMEDQVRCISYDFGEDFLKLTAIGTTCAARVGVRRTWPFASGRLPVADCP